MSFLYKPWTSEYQSQYTWKIRNQFRKPQDILEKHLEEIKQLQDENLKKLSLLEESLKGKFVPEEDELGITERKIKKEENLVLPKLNTEDGCITKAENVVLPPITDRPSSASKSVKAEKSCKSPVADDKKEEEKNQEKKHKEVNEQVEALISHYRRDGYGNNPYIGNKPTSFEYEKMKKLPTPLTTIKNYDENLKEKRAKIYDAYRKEIDLRRLKQLFPYVNFDDLNINAQTQTYDDGIICGTYLSEYGAQYVNWSCPPLPYSRRFEKAANKVKTYENNVGSSTLDDSKKKKEEEITDSTITSLTKNVEKLGLKDEDLEICEKCNGYYIKKEKPAAK